MAVERVCRERGEFAPRVLHRASDLLFLLSLVRVEQAVALLPDLHGAEQDERVAVRSIVGGDLTRTIYGRARWLGAATECHRSSAGPRCRRT